jgi:hypothetical protein
MDEFGSLALIFVFAPCKAGKKVEWRSEGFGYPNLGATSRVIRKYGSCGNKYRNWIRSWA